MLCLNPECGSLKADEVNVSVNTSGTLDELNEIGRIEYTGDSEYGDMSDLIGTACQECNEITYLANWQDIVIGWTGQATKILT
jgi:hypothetical protein